ncbi:phospholipase domain-containing protein, partial [Nocardioides hankookensis]
ALAGGDAPAVVERWGTALGAPGTLLLRTPWTTRAWVSDEVCDHTSLIQLCERWTAGRGHEARIWLTEWRRRVCGDLLLALDLGEPVELPDGASVRPLPYAPTAEIRVTDGAVSLVLANAGATRGIHLRVDGADGPDAVTVPESSVSRPRVVTVPVAVRDGRYDVTVTGPGFARHFTGPHLTGPHLTGPHLTGECDE